MRPVQTCSVPGCGRRHHSRGLCNAHRQQARKGQSPGPIRPRVDHNDVIIEGDVAQLVLTNRQGLEVTRVMVDIQDLALVTEIRWGAQRASGAIYAAGRTKNGRRYVLIHRLLMSPPPGMEIDHINGNSLDNRRANLRIVTHQENAQNVARRDRRAEHRNVAFIKSKRCWRAKIHVGGKEYSKICKSEEEAIEVARQLRAKHMTHHNEARHAAKSEAT